MINLAKIPNESENGKKLNGAWCVPIYAGKALVLKRVDGQWDFPGGTIDAGEKSPEAAIRELREEVGMELTIDDLHPIGVDIIDGRYLNLFFAIVSDDKSQEIFLKEDEHTEYKWIESYKDIPGELNPPTAEFKKQGWLDNLDIILTRSKG